MGNAAVGDGRQVRLLAGLTAVGRADGCWLEILAFGVELRVVVILSDVSPTAGSSGQQPI